jgi:Na+-transporting methylmalonyl-CoA/oxaloacetate decarboxylase beta subunit
VVLLDSVVLSVISLILSIGLIYLAKQRSVQPFLLLGIGGILLGIALAKSGLDQLSIPLFIAGGVCSLIGYVKKAGGR